MALTATGTLSAGGLLTVGAPSGGTLQVGMSFTNASITEPQDPAPYITSLGTGTGGAGTYNTNLNQSISSSTFTFILWDAPIAQVEPAPTFTVNSGTTPAVPNAVKIVPPPPLPQTLTGTTAVTSYST